MTTDPYDPNVPPPDPARVAVLMAIDLPSDPAKLNAAYLNRTLTIDGRPVTDDEYRLMGESTPNDLRAMSHLARAEADAAKEDVRNIDRMDELLSHYGFGGNETIEQIRDRMNAEDRDELNKIMDILAPGGYVVTRK
jgi:hypothetical protein